MDLQLPGWLVQVATLYFTAGAIALLVDLWRSKRVTDDDRLWWTVVLLCFGFLLAPLYWFMVLNKDAASHCANTTCPKSATPERMDKI